MDSNKNNMLISYCFRDQTSLQRSYCRVRVRCIFRNDRRTGVNAAAYRIIKGEMDIRGSVGYGYGGYPVSFPYRDYIITDECDKIMKGKGKGEKITFLFF